MILRHQNTGHNPNIQLDIPDSQDLRQDILDTFEEINGEGFINHHRRVTLNGAFDMHHTAFTIPADIRYMPTTNLLGPFPESTVVLDGAKYAIRLHIKASLNQQRFLVGHEIGHIALFHHYLNISDAALREYNQSIRRDFEGRKQQEAFCDYFSLRLLGFTEIPEEIDWDNLPNLHE